MQQILKTANDETIYVINELFDLEINILNMTVRQALSSMILP